LTQAAGTTGKLLNKYTSFYGVFPEIEQIPRKKPKFNCKKTTYAAQLRIARDTENCGPHFSHLLT